MSTALFTLILLGFFAPVCFFAATCANNEDNQKSDPKSGASANSATFARLLSQIYKITAIRCRGGRLKPRYRVGNPGRTGARFACVINRVHEAKAGYCDNGNFLSIR